jgi:stage V sporulation protein D (sporulation-specific penicillin-binding protein)
VLVVVAEPKGGIYYGGQVAAPVFQAVVRDTLRYLGIPETPGLVKPKEPWEVETPRVEVTVPNVVNYPVEDACRAIQSAGLKYRTRGEGEIVYEQTPGAGARVNGGTTVILELQPVGKRKSGDPVTVPDLRGLSIKEAGNLLENIGLRLAPEGSGVAIEQSVKPGQKVAEGTVIKVKFTPPGREPGEKPPAGGTSPGEMNSLENPYHR